MKNSQTERTIIWHYTTVHSLQQIVAEGVIRLAVAGVDLTRERPVVWFSIADKWEETANKAVRLLDGTALGPSREVTRFYAGLARIGCGPEAAPYTWKDWRRLSGCPAWLVNGLRQSAHAHGSRIAGWRVSFTPVGRAQWRTIEVWNSASNAWEPMSSETVFGCPEAP